jgi:HK97 gp10 family phage protein
MSINLRATAQYTPRSDAGRFIASNIVPAVLEAAAAMGQVVLLEAQAIVPVDTGELKASGRTAVRQTGSSVVADVEFTAPHAAYVEYGTGIRGQESAGAGPYPYSPTWPGMPAQPYLRPALEVARAEAVGEFALRIREELGVS